MDFFIPRPTKLYSLYAEGVALDVTETDGGSVVSIDDRYVVTLYYRIGTHRHLYIATASVADQAAASKRMLSGAQEPLYVLSELTGRAFDRYKRAMFRLKTSYPRVVLLPPLFFIQLGELCATGRNSTRNVSGLVDRYRKC